MTIIKKSRSLESFDSTTVDDLDDKHIQLSGLLAGMDSKAERKAAILIEIDHFGQQDIGCIRSNYFVIPVSSHLA